ncbi:MAG: trypsin-like serine protease [Deltaproteobacteria bacterium]|nr:MAG: trypsin-like serine protease [Deltaproteobacteria bacterium]
MNTVAPPHRARLAFPLLALLLVGRRADAVEPRIVNGVPTQQRPTTGVLLLRNASFSAFFGICSGTLIGCQHFVTAGHCVCNGGDFATCGTPNPADFAVYLQHVGLLAVSAIDVNPAYDGTSSDVSVLTLAAPITGVHPTKLNTTGNPTVGMAGSIAGYGVTDGPSNDFGILRQGSVVISSCGGFFPEPDMTCWTFDAPVGPPGTDSDTCFGDSGGPLFVDFGSGDVLAGATAAGTSGNCRPTDISDDTNIFQNRTFIQSIGGADLSSTSCGAITQVGDPGTTITTDEFHGIDRDAQTCRALVRKRYSAYASTELKLMQACLDGVDEGHVSGPCPDAATASRIASAAARVDPTVLGIRCPAVPTILPAGPCAGVSDANGLATCLLAAGDAQVTNLLDVEYANASPSTPIADADLLDCQEAIAKATGTYGSSRLKALAKCQGSEDKGWVTSCPDANTTARIGTAAARVQPTIEAKCTNAQVQMLDTMATFGDGCSGTTSTAGLATCEIAAHDTEVGTLVSTLGDASSPRLVSFTIAPGTARLRATLNGIDAGVNDIDLYLKQGAPPTTVVFDSKSDNAGVYESIDLPTPTAGTWYALVQPFGGTNVPFQLTITSFQ